MYIYSVEIVQRLRPPADGQTAFIMVELLLLIIVFGCLFVGALLKFAFQCINNNGHDGRGPIGHVILLALVVVPLFVFYKGYQEAQDAAQEASVLIAILIFDLIFVMSLSILSLIWPEQMNKKFAWWGFLIAGVLFAGCVWLLMKEDGGAFILELLTYSVDLNDKLLSFYLFV